MSASPMHRKFAALLEQSRALGPLPVPTAIAHPCDRVALEGMLAARDAGLILPLVYGPRSRIETLAQQSGLSLAGVHIEDAPHSHAAAAAAVAGVRRGDAELLMKGSLHTDELMSAVMSAETGLRTGRRISHCFLLDVPAQPHLLVVSDGAINIAPGLAEKVDIVANAIALADCLQFQPVRVAILAATESVTADQPATLHAAALCKMMERGQLPAALIDGPLALDNAIDPAAARIKGLKSSVAGHANVLIAPDLTSGNLLAKSLSFLAGADVAGVVMGARVPIVLTSRADSVLARLVSCALAVRLVRSIGPGGR